MRNLCFICGLLTLALAACAPNWENMPSDFSLELAWNTGSLPPEYTYSYVIIVTPDLQGTFEYQFGYDNQAEYIYSEVFQITQEQLDFLYHYLRDQNLFRSDWKEPDLREMMEGSPGSGLRLTAFGNHYHLPSLSELSGADYAQMEAAIETIGEVVPDELWDEMRARQQLYEINIEE